MQNLYKLLLTLIISLSVFSLSSHDLKGAISSEDRTPANKLRDSERNPYETLSFFWNRVRYDYSRTFSWRRLVYRNSC